MEFRCRLHCTDDSSSCRCVIFQTWDATCNANLSNAPHQVRTQNKLKGARICQRLHKIKVGSTHWWSQSWLCLTEHNSLSAKAFWQRLELWVGHCEIVTCLTETCEVANLRCNLQFCQRLACEDLKSRPICLRTVRPWCFNVWPHLCANAKIHAVYRRTSPKLACDKRVGFFPGAPLLLKTGLTFCVILNRQATLWSRMIMVLYTQRNYGDCRNFADCLDSRSCPMIIAKLQDWAQTTCDDSPRWKMVDRSPQKLATSSSIG